MEENVTVEKKDKMIKNVIKSALIIVGALAVLFTKEYVSAKLLMGLVFLDFVSTGFVSKIPMPVCFIVFMALTVVAAY